MNQIKIRREKDQIIVERTYKIVPNRTVEFNQRPKIDFSVIKSYVVQALKARMEYCLNQLDAEILPAEDKIFNEMGTIFSPSKGLYFNQQSFESMENALKKLEEASLSENMIHDFDLIELSQITKALISYGGDLPEKEAHYLAGFVVEGLFIPLANNL